MAAQQFERILKQWIRLQLHSAKDMACSEMSMLPMCYECGRPRNGETFNQLCYAHKAFIFYWLYNTRFSGSNGLLSRLPFWRVFHVAQAKAKTELVESRNVCMVASVAIKHIESLKACPILLTTLSICAAGCLL